MRPSTLTAALGAVLVLLCGCGGPSGAAGSRAGSTRTVEHVAGTTQVPADPQRIVTTSDQNALLPLLELGVVPVASAGLQRPEGGHEFRRTEGLDTSGVAFAGPYGELDLEAIAGQRPDLIVGSEHDEPLYDELSAIAPTVLVATHSQPLADALEDFAEVVGAQGRAAQDRAAFDARLAELSRRLDPLRGRLVVSTLEDNGDGTFGAASWTQSFSVLAQLGLARPDAQSGAPEGTAFGYESLRRHDADVVWLVDYSGEGGGARPAVSSSALWPRLAAVRSGQAHVVDGTAAVGSAWRSLHRVLDHVERTLLAPDVEVDALSGR